MLKLIYEGRQLYQLLDMIQDHFVIMDWDNHLPFEQENFIFVLDDLSEESFLRRLPDKTAVYVKPKLRHKLDRSDYPRLLFLEELTDRLDFPCRIHLAGDLESALDFTGFVLGQVSFCVGYAAGDYRLERLEHWHNTSNTGFDGQLQPENGQNLILDFTTSQGASHQLVFWDGREESLHQLIRDDISLPRLIANVGKRVKQSDFNRLSYIYHIPKLKWLKPRAYRKLWQDLTALTDEMSLNQTGTDETDENRVY